MLTGIIVAILLVLCSIFIGRFDKVLAAVISILILFFGAMIAFTCPVYEEEPEIEEKSLIALAEKGGQDIYLMVSKDGSYIYKIAEHSDKYDINEENIYIFSDNVEVFEEENGNRAVFRKNIYKDKLTLFTIAIGQEKVEYAFLVPKGSIDE